tara:strand:- start:105 stop:479 length:375 start_codon:yes stop_codon:yes gene_type:complete
MTIVPQDIKDRFAETVAIPDGTLQVIIDDTVPFFNEIRWGAFYVKGHCLYAMHVYATNLDSSGGDTSPNFPVASETADSVAVSYSAPSGGSPSDAWLGSTTYGQQYLRYRKIVGFGGWTPNVTQ